MLTNIVIEADHWVVQRDVVYLTKQRIFEPACCIITTKPATVKYGGEMKTAHTCTSSIVTVLLKNRGWQRFSGLCVDACQILFNPYSCRISIQISFLDYIR